MQNLKSVGMYFTLWYSLWSSSKWVRYGKMLTHYSLFFFFFLLCHDQTAEIYITLPLNHLSHKLFGTCIDDNEKAETIDKFCIFSTGAECRKVPPPTPKRRDSIKSQQDTESNSLEGWVDQFHIGIILCIIDIFSNFSP